MIKTMKVAKKRPRTKGVRAKRTCSESLTAKMNLVRNQQTKLLRLLLPLKIRKIKKSKVISSIIDGSLSYATEKTLNNRSWLSAFERMIEYTDRLRASAEMDAIQDILTDTCRILFSYAPTFSLNNCLL